MQRGFVVFCLTLGVLAFQFLGVHGGEGKPAAKKRPIPTSAAQAKIESLIQEIYKEDIAKAQKDAAAKTRLALVFLQEGRDTTDDAAGRYMLFLHARDLAAQAGDAPTALQAIEELAQDFAVPAAEVFQMKVKALTQASTAVALPDAYQTVVDSSLVLLEDALAADDYTVALQLLATAENAAKKLRSVPLVSSIRRRQEEALTLQKEYQAWKPFADALAKNPADAKANLEMGKYQAFIKGSWDRGLPLLAKGSDAQIKHLAALELTDPDKAASQIELASGWQDLAAKSQGTMKIQLLLHAYYWYQQVLGGAEGTTYARVEKTMQAIMTQLPAENRIGDIAVEVRRCEGHGGPVFDAVFSPDGKKAVSAGQDGSLRLWDTKTGKEIRRLDGHNGRVWTVAFAPDGRRVASGGFDATIRLWDLASGREIRRFTGSTDYVRSVAFSHDGHLLLSGGDDRMVRLWNVDTGKEIKVLPGHDHFVWSVALSRDGKRALSASLDKTVRLWDLETGTTLRVLKGHKDTVLSAAFSPDGRRAISGSTDKTLKLWDLESGKELRTFTGHKGYVHSVAFSPDGRRVLSASQDNTVRLWDVHTGEELHRLEGHRDQVWSVAFSRDGRLAISAGQDQSVRVWGSSR